MPKANTIAICLFAACLITFVTSAGYSYDRDYAVIYARLWSEDTGLDDGVANTTVYYKYDLDCANFVSQCLIAGGIRFRSSTSGGENDNTRHPFMGESFPELETAYNSARIKDSDLKKYSRTIPGSNNLPRSMMHSRHTGGAACTLYMPPDLQDSGAMWADVVPGDLFLQWDSSNERYSHDMFITGVSHTSPKDILFTAHENWREDHSANADPGTSWKTDGVYRVLCLPDAPVIQEYQLYSGGELIKFKWAEKWASLSPESGRDWAGKKELMLKVTFDTNMDITRSPSISLMVGTSNYDFQNWPAGDGINSKGWWVNENSADFRQFRTWKGRILAGNLPSAVHGTATVCITAFADDGSSNDATNELSKYETGDYKGIRFRLDTRAQKAK